MPFLDNDTPEPQQYEPSFREMMARFAPALPVSYREPEIKTEPETVKPKVKASVERSPDGRAAQVSVNGRFLKVVRDETGRFTGLQETD